MNIIIQGHKQFDLKYDSVKSHQYIKYNVNDSLNKFKNIDIFNRFFCEWCSMYFIYKNNLKSNIICFCHYRRQINYKHINLGEIVKNNSVQIFYLLKDYKLGLTNKNKEYPCIYNYLSLCNLPYFAYLDIEEYINQQEIIDKNKLKEFCNRESVDFITRSIFCTTWDNFLIIARFIDGYIEYTANKYNLGYDLEKWKSFYIENVIKHFRNYPYTCNSSRTLWQDKNRYDTIYNDDYGYQTNNCWRLYSYTIELLIGFCISCMENSYFYNRLYV